MSHYFNFETKQSIQSYLIRFEALLTSKPSKPNLSMPEKYKLIFTVKILEVYASFTKIPQFLKV
jgi:hypothetical protein